MPNNSTHYVYKIWKLKCHQSHRAVLYCCRWCSLSRRAARWSVPRTRPSRSTKPCPAAGRPRQPPGRASAASGATSTPSRASWSSFTSISTPRRTSPSCQHRNLQTKSLCENRKSSLVLDMSTCFGYVHMSTSMQLNLFIVWSLEFSIVNSQVNCYIVVQCTYLAGFYETVPRISNNFLLLL